MMGGHIGVNSVYGKGSEFHFTVPMDVQQHGQKRQNVFPKNLKGLKTLVVDDNQSARLVMENYMRDFNFRVDAVDSGENALRQVDKHLQSNDPYKLIFMDWKMTGIDGVQTAKKIRELTKGKIRPKLSWSQAMTMKKLWPRRGLWA